MPVIDRMVILSPFTGAKFTEQEGDALSAQGGDILVDLFR
jgi:hypothetical protein